LSRNPAGRGATNRLRVRSSRIAGIAEESERDKSIWESSAFFVSTAKMPRNHTPPTLRIKVMGIELIAVGVFALVVAGCLVLAGVFAFGARFPFTL
jgi:hypothetical protein